MTKSLPQNSYLRPLNADDLDQVVQLEALMPQSQLSTPDLINYKLSICPELCAGVFIRTYKNPTYNFNEVGTANGDAPGDEHKYFKVSEATDISEKLIALILGFKSGHDNEESENGPAAAVNSRTTQHADSGRVVDVTAVVVQPEFRESSVGTTLFKDYIQRLATVGVADRIRVRVPADSSVAEFFERLGFEKRGDKTQDGFLVLENTIEEDDDSMENDQDY